jgi:hypothetical protein
MTKASAMARVYVRADPVRRPPSRVEPPAMANKALETYLNDHLAGSRLGVDLARQIRDRVEGTPLHDTLARIADEIDEERDKLTGLMDRLGASENQVKQATAWVGEKASRLKLSDLGGLLGSGDEDYGLFISLETLELGVVGKQRLWEALKEVASLHDGLDPAELEALAAQARRQRDTLESARLAVAKRAFAGD